LKTLDRLKKLAESVDALAEKDDLLIRRAEQITAMRMRAAVALHSVCAGFVDSLNTLLSRTTVTLDPREFGPECFREDGTNLFQINVRGRILQVDFRATPELISTEEFRVPYTLEGAVRCFNQQLLEQDIVREHLLFYCLEKDRDFWRFFDERTYRTGPVDTDYFSSLLEQLL
jgi:hypothetical protein